MAPTMVERRFECCTTAWLIQAVGPRASEAVQAAEGEVQALEKVLNSFDSNSAVARLNHQGRLTNPHVATLVRRALEYHDRTQGVFQIGHGHFEHELKAFIAEGRATVPAMRGRAIVRLEGDLIITTGPLDLNGIAKGYIVDRAQAVLERYGVDGFVDGGGDIAHPTGPVAITSPYGPEDLGVLDTRWNIATSGNARRRRGNVDHIYDPRDGHVGARNDQVTVLARRDCVEADVLATTLAAMTIEEGFGLITQWPDVEALWVHEGRQWATAGFVDHVWKP